MSVSSISNNVGKTNGNIFASTTTKLQKQMQLFRVMCRQARAHARQNVAAETQKGTLKLREGESFLFGLIERKAQYTYTTTSSETPAQIRKKFNLKPGALLKCNPYIVDAEEPFGKGAKVYFYAEDVQM